MYLAFPAALGLLFIALKLAGLIAWSWVWVLFPLGCGLVFGLCFELTGFLIATFVGVTRR